MVSDETNATLFFFTEARLSAGEGDIKPTINLGQATGYL